MTSQADDDEALFLSTLRGDFVFFAKWCFGLLHPGDTYEHNWHIEAIAHALSRCQSGLALRLLITMPPRHMKSLCVSVIWPAFMLGHNPSLKIILASYGNELSEENLRLLRTILESERYQQAFPEVRLEKATAKQLLTTAQGAVRAKSMGGPLTGFGGDYIIIDDPIKQTDAQSPAERERLLTAFRGTLVVRRSDPRRARIVIVMQRVHEDDLAGHAAATGGYEVLNLPAIAVARTTHALYGGGVHIREVGSLLWSERFTQEVLDSLRQEMGEYEFALVCTP